MLIGLLTATKLINPTLTILVGKPKVTRNIQTWFENI